MKGYKAFDKNMVAYLFDRKRQYAEHTVFEDNEIGLNAGLAFYVNPFELLDDYGFVNYGNGEFNNFAQVDALCEASTNEVGRVYRTSRLKVGDRMSFDEYVRECVEFAASETSTSGGITEKCVFIDEARGKTSISSEKWKTCIASSKAAYPISNSSDLACVVSTSNVGNISNSGESATIGNTGRLSCISSAGLDTTIANSGDGCFVSSSGDGTVIGNLGSSTSIASSGVDTRINSDGEDCVICCAGGNSCAKARKGSWITLSEWKHDSDKNRDVPVCVKTEYVDGDRIKEDTYYTLKDGEFCEVDA
nr:MAG TPA: hypothetical protein [Caudoviricetes sp.]